MTDTPDNYDKAHRFIKQARECLAAHDTEAALPALIDAVEASTTGWGELDEESWEDTEPAGLPTVPSPQTLLREQKNAVQALHEWAQKAGKAPPQFIFSGGGPFSCTCSMLELSADSAAPRRTKNEAKHDAAIRMLSTLRGTCVEAV